MTRLGVAVVLSIALARPADAGTRPAASHDSPRSLAMRAAAAEAQAEPASPERPTLPLVPVPPRRRTTDNAQDVALPPPPLSERVIFRFNLGFELDDGRPSGEPNLAGHVPSEITDYERLRLRGFGDAVIGSRGIGAASLSTYLAMQFHFDETPERATAAPRVYDDPSVPELQIRSAYGEADELFDHPLARPIHLRAGRQFRYGLAVSHFDGITVGYDRPGVEVALFGGQRVSLWGLASDVAPVDDPISGIDLRLDLFELGGWPVVLTASAVTFDDHDHNEAGLAFRWSRDVLVRASVRGRDGALARESLSLRARVSEVTTVNLQIDNRSGGHWIYDFLLIEPSSDPTDPRRYLDLGPVLPRAHVDFRAGTVLFDNIDLLLRAAAALEHGDDDEAASSMSSSYLEGGAALEVRVRRALRVGSSFTARRYRLEDRQRLDLRPGRPDALDEDTSALGPRSFYEGGLQLRTSTGARHFSAGAELYARVYSPESPYVADSAEELDLRSGGRFSVEGWAGQRLRLKAEYDVTLSRLDLAPELDGIKTLRVLMEGRF